jgi:iron complex outermembrane receptor protein
MHRIDPSGLVTGRTLGACVSMVLAGFSSIFAAPVWFGPAWSQVPPASEVQPGALAGKVIDEEGRPIARAEVRLPDLSRATLTREDGTFRIDSLAPGLYRLAVDRLGYEPVVRDVRVDGATFVLSPVIVTATRSPIAPMQSPLPSETLFGEQLRRYQTVSLAHALEPLPGMRTLSTGAQVGKPVIRGLTGARVLVLDDGHRLEDYSWSDEDGPSVDARQVERVEVIRGPASVLYGSNALGGVVNAIPPDFLGVAEGSVVHTAIEAYAATNNREVGTALRVEGATPGVGWRLHAIGRGSGNLRTPAGELQNTGFGAFNGEAAVGARGERGNVTLRYVRYGGEFKLLEAEGPPPVSGGGMEEEGPERKLADDRVQLDAVYLVGGLRLEARSQWQRHSLIEVADEPGSASGSGQESEQFNLLLDTWTLDVLAHHANDRVHGSLGASGLAQQNDTRGPIALVPDARTVSGAIFAFEQVDVGRWSLLGGARGDWQQLDADANAQLDLADESRTYDRFSGDVGTVFHPVSEVALAANVGRAWRAPTLFELFANGPHVGEARYEIGNPDLAPETVLAIDGSVRWQWRRLRGEVAVFRNTIDRYIFVTPTDEFVDGLQVYRHDQSDAVLEGAEIVAAGEAFPGLTLRGRLETVRGTNTSTDTPLPLVPPARGTLGGSYEWGACRFFDRASLGATLELVAEQKRRSEFDTPTADYALVHLDAGISRHWADRDVMVDLQVRNVTNTEYRDYLSRYKSFAADPGRNVLVRVSTGF